jgi:hypothetical protein
VKNRIEFTFRQHGFDRFVIGKAGIFDIRRQGDLHIILDLRNPLDAIQRHAVLMLENAAHP